MKIGETVSWQRSSLQSIFTCGTFKMSSPSTDEDILLHKRIVEDLKQMEEGILIKGKLHRFGLAIYVADNLEV